MLSPSYYQHDNRSSLGLIQHRTTKATQWVYFCYSAKETFGYLSYDWTVFKMWVIKSASSVAVLSLITITRPFLSIQQKQIQIKQIQTISQFFFTSSRECGEEIGKLFFTPRIIITSPRDQLVRRLKRFSRAYWMISLVDVRHDILKLSIIEHADVHVLNGEYL